MIFQPEDLLKLLLALLLGGVIGAEREIRDKAAGLRTLMFICSGSALFTILSVRLAGNNDPNRIAAQIVSGIGFLGAGVIMRERGEIHGLTTAAVIWMVAALGVSVGGGQYTLAFFATLVGLLALLLFPHLERMMNRYSQTRTYVVTFPAEQDRFEALEARIRALGLHAHIAHRDVSEGQLTCTWVVSGRPQAQEILVNQLMQDPEVKGFEV